MSNPSHTVAIYARVSTDDKGQDPENQLKDLRAWCKSAGHEVVGEYVDYESGRKGVEQRKQLAQLFSDAPRRTFSLVLFWSLDRFSREGMTQTVLHLQRLNSHGVAFHSYTEEFLSTDNELVRDILLSTLSSLAKLEAQKISQRTKAGLERARAKGKQIGRARIDPNTVKEIKRLSRQKPRPSIRSIAKSVGVSHTTVRQYL